MKARGDDKDQGKIYNSQNILVSETKFSQWGEAIEIKTFVFVIEFEM